MSWDFNFFSLPARSILDLDELLKKCDELSEDENVADNEKEIAILEELLTRVSYNVCFTSIVFLLVYKIIAPFTRATFV